ncbi:MAG TPA: ATPase [Candidatus Marinimicrobia bacterium]|nr:ATPase [Candidatus Neomarinimicrobiota bacterium]
MIVPMQKVTLFISTRHREAALLQLRKLGLLHIQHLKAPISEDVSQLEAKLNTLEKSLLIIENEARGVADRTDKKDDIEKLVDEILALSAEAQQISDIVDEKQNLLAWFERWGKISPTDIEELNKKGIFLRLYNTDKSVLKDLPENLHVEIISADKNRVLLALISESEDTRLEIKEEFIPREDYPSVIAELDRLTKRSKEIDKRMTKLAQYADQIQDYKQDLEKRLEFATVKSGMRATDEICYLQGYCPENKVERLTQAAANEGWGYLSEEPDETDNPPTLLKLNKLVSLIRPVFDFLGTVPGYREYDVSMYFLIFFALFVAMIIGDAGYGVIFLLISMFAHRKSVKKGQPLALAVKLFYVLSMGTIAWGTITGNWFGAVQIAGLPFFKALTIPQIATFPELFPGMNIDPQRKVMFICFVIAVVQLGLANIMNFVNELPQLKSIAHLGWFAVIVGLFFLVLNLVLGMAMPVFAVPLIIGGLTAVILFVNQEKGTSILRGIAKGVGGAFTTFLDAVSSFSNIISYIRLFAVGMATVAIASSFNQIAAPLIHGYTFPAAALILLIGHGLNIVMGLLSVVVHGIRLNMLEFSGQLGMEWTGYEYKPFQEKIENITEGEIK